MSTHLSLFNELARRATIKPRESKRPELRAIHTIRRICALDPLRTRQQRVPYHVYMSEVKLEIDDAR